MGFSGHGTPCVKSCKLFLNGPFAVRKWVHGKQTNKKTQQQQQQNPDKQQQQIKCGVLTLSMRYSATEMFAIVILSTTTTTTTQQVVLGAVFC